MKAWELSPATRSESFRAGAHLTRCGFSPTLANKKEQHKLLFLFGAGGGTAAERHAFDRANQAALTLAFLGLTDLTRWVLILATQQKSTAPANGVLCFLASYDNFDTVSKGFTGFHFPAVWFHFALREMKP